MKRVISITLIIAFLIAAGFVIYQTIVPSKVKISSGLDAIPAHSSMIIKSKSLLDLHEDLNATEFWSTNTALPYFHQMDSLLAISDSWCQSKPQISKALNGREIYLSVIMSGTNQHHTLMSVELDENEWQSFSTQISNDTKSLSTTDRLYEEVNITEKKLSDQLFLSYAYHQNVLLISLNPTIIEDAIRQINHGRSLATNPVFTKLLKTTDSNSDLNLFVNFEEFNPLLDLYLEGGFAKNFGHFANWSEFDLSIDKNGFKGNGFLLSNDSLQNHIYCWNGLEASKMNFQNVLPANTGYFVNLSINDWEQFIKNRKGFLDKNGRLYQVEKKLNAFQEKYTELAVKELNTIFDGDVSLFYTEVKSNESFEKKCALAMQLQNIEIGQKTFKELIEKHNASGFTENFMNYDIFENNIVFLDKYLGQPFDQCEANYFCFLEDFVIFSNDLGNLKHIINSYSKGSTLQKSNDFQLFMEQFENKQSFLAYYNFRFGGHLLQQNLKQNVQKDHLNAVDTLKRWESIAFSFQSSDELYYASIFAKFNPVVEDVSIALSETKLDTALNAIPTKVLNHYTKQNEFILQDAKNNIYLISSNGRKLWKLPLGEKIISEVYQVDRYKNNKLQYLFNTRSSIYMIDRNGEMVENFPVTIPSKATNGITLLDYDNNRNYRILVANEKNEILNFDIKGQAVKGWEKPKTPNELNATIEWIAIKGKDYIMAMDNGGQLTVFDRRGSIRLKINEQLPPSKNYYFNASNSLGTSGWITTDSIGTVYQLNLDDTKLALPLKAFSKQHHFYLTDVDGDVYKDYVFLDEEKIYAFKLTKSKIFEYENSDIHHIERLFFANTSQGAFIGFNDLPNQKSYLLNGSGNLIEDFPVEGSTPLNVFNLDGKNDFRLIIGDQSGSVYFYSIKI